MNAFFVGIGGMGMSGLAKILHSKGFKVAGSDRNLSGDYCRQLQTLGIKIYGQDGKGIGTYLEEHSLKPEEITIVKSTAVEDNVPDIVAARELQIREIMRSDLLANMFNGKKGIAIGGTAGKTTTSGIVAWILKFCGLEPSCAIGGMISGLETNALHGSGSCFVIEADESDGSIVKYRPYISIVTNIHRDHKSIEELNDLFSTFIANTNPSGHAIICGDDMKLRALAARSKSKYSTYGLGSECTYRAQNVYEGRDYSSFKFENTVYTLPLAGLHNVRNALGAVVTAKFLNIPPDETAAALKAFQGMKRRFEKIGIVKGVTVIDDFAHNPVEIAAVIETARRASQRRFIVYQPHGFGPTRFTKNELIEVFQNLSTNEFLYMDDIYYGGGTVEKDISSEDIIKEVRKTFSNAYYLGDRQRIISTIAENARSGDMVLVLGARDINSICRQILTSLE